MPARVLSFLGSDSFNGFNRDSDVLKNIDTFRFLVPVPIPLIPAFISKEIFKDFFKER